MDGQEIIKTLQRNQAELRSLGIRRVDLFGSHARGDAREDSDIDLLVDFADPVGLLTIVRLQSRLSRMLGNRSIDLVPRSCVPAPKLQDIEKDLVNAYSN